jgi:hypothetical protein
MNKPQATPAFVTQRDGCARHLGVLLTLAGPLAVVPRGAARGASGDGDLPNLVRNRAKTHNSCG